MNGDHFTQRLREALADTGAERGERLGALEELEIAAGGFMDECFSHAEEACDTGRFAYC